MKNSKNFADSITSSLGSWRFILIQSILIGIWVLGNTLGIFKIDPYPFIFLNLALSFQAAFTAPIIMMSQNKQAESDRQVVHKDLKVNILAEKEINSIIKDLSELNIKVEHSQKLLIELENINTQIAEIKNKLA
jgi:uncharacterized membrane protein